MSRPDHLDHPDHLDYLYSSFVQAPALKSRTHACLCIHSLTPYLDWLISSIVFSYNLLLITYSLTHSLTMEKRNRSRSAPISKTAELPAASAPCKSRALTTRASTRTSGGGLRLAPILSERKGLCGAAYVWAGVGSRGGADCAAEGGGGDAHDYTGCLFWELYSIPVDRRLALV